MQLIKKNIILVLLGITVLLIFAAGFYFGTSQGSAIQNIRKMFDSSISEFEEERTQRSEESLIKKPTSSQILTSSPTPTSAQAANPTATSTSSPPFRPTLTLALTSTQRVLATPTPTLTTTRRTSSTP